MDYKLIYLPAAKNDINSNALYISDQLHARKAAGDLLEALDKAISTLGQFPYAYKVYQPIKPLKNEYRLLPVNNYAVFYVVKEERQAVEIYRVIYARMDLAKLIE